MRDKNPHLSDKGRRIDRGRSVSELRASHHRDRDKFRFGFSDFVRTSENFCAVSFSLADSAAPRSVPE